MSLTSLASGLKVKYSSHCRRDFWRHVNRLRVFATWLSLGRVAAFIEAGGEERAG